jgi:hypothetical protein
MKKPKLDPRELKKYFTALGSQGGTERAKRLTAEERKAIAQKAAKASAQVRSKKAKAK